MELNTLITDLESVRDDVVKAIPLHSEEKQKRLNEQIQKLNVKIQDLKDANSSEKTIRTSTEKINQRLDNLMVKLNNNNITDEVRSELDGCFEEVRNLNKETLQTLTKYLNNNKNH